MTLKSILSNNRDSIIRQCTRAIQGSGMRYSQRSVRELARTTSRIADANYHALVNDDYSMIDRCIEEITAMRLHSGFALSEVQQAFDVHRTILVPMLTETLRGRELTHALHKLNGCLSYTISKFSDYYQDLHEKQIREYAEILEQRVAQRTRELSESEAKYRMLVEEINDGYFVNQKGRIVFANNAFCDMHGYRPDEIVGRRYLDLVSPTHESRLKDYYGRRFKREHVPELYVYERRHKDGTLLPTENKVKIMKYEGNDATVGICRDITERTKMEQRVRESERLAHIGQLTTSLAHEIRNPLSSIKMSIQMALKAEGLDPNGKRTMEISQREIARLENILTEMLDFARPVQLNLKPGSINDLIDSCLDLLELRIRKKGIVVKKQLARGTGQVLIDRDKMEQAIINVLLNAIQALSAGGTILITTKYEKNPERLITVHFEDNGPGLSDEDVSFVFNPFFSKKKKGTGLGLSNVKKIIEGHGGTVTARAMAKGFCLSFALPWRTRNG